MTTNVHSSIRHRATNVILGIFLIVFQLATIVMSQIAFCAEGGSTVYAPGLYGDFGMADIGSEGLEVTALAYYQRATAPKTLKRAQLNTNLSESSSVFVPMATYVTNYKLLGGTYFAGFRLGIAYNTAKGDAGIGQSFQTERDEQFGIEDPYIFPFGLSWQVQDMHLTFFQGVNVPIGQYNRDNLATVSSHYWASDTNFAFTWVHPEKEHEISFNVGYLINARNPATKYHTGQGVHLDFLIGQHFSNELSVGIAGYVYRQVTGDTGSGALGGPFKLQANGVGPAVNYSLETELADIDFTAKWLQDFGVSNGLSGSHFFLEASFHF